MKILILEDNAERIRIFKKHLEHEHELYFFDQVEEAERALDEFGPFECIYLDHDLDGRVFVDPEEPNTGYQLAKAIAERNVDARIVLHTMNPFGAARMKEVLPRAHRIVFDELFDMW
jgi:CheY-like chemotaxis protein